MYKHIILAYDGSTSGQNALLSIKELAQWEKPKFTLLAVVPTPLDAGSMEMGYLAHTDTTGFEYDLKNQLRRGVKSLRAMGFDATGELLRGEVIRELTRYAEEKSADLIVVGHTHEKNLFKRWWSGSTAKSLVDEASCNVLIVIGRQRSSQ
ncbi:MAG: universal stress protein [Limnohabitans sp.]|nr:universal stress protein [Limnohabitans sp.]